MYVLTFLSDVFFTKYTTQMPETEALFVSEFNNDHGRDSLPYFLCSDRKPSMAWRIVVLTQVLPLLVEIIVVCL